MKAKMIRVSIRFPFELRVWWVDSERKLDAWPGGVGQAALVDGMKADEREERSVVVGTILDKSQGRVHDNPGIVAANALVFRNVPAVVVIVLRFVEFALVGIERGQNIPSRKPLGESGHLHQLGKAVMIPEQIVTAISLRRGEAVAPHAGPRGVPAGHDLGSRRRASADAQAVWNMTPSLAMRSRFGVLASSLP